MHCLALLRKMSAFLKNINALLENIKAFLEKIKAFVHIAHDGTLHLANQLENHVFLKKVESDW